MKYPVARQTSDADHLHGVVIPDPYRWLEDQDAPETREWLSAQEALLKDYLSEPTTASLRDSISGKLSQLLRIDAVGIPLCRGNNYFFMKRLAGSDQNVICRRIEKGGDDEVVLDPLILYPDGLTSYSILSVSENAELLVYSVRSGGADEIQIKFWNVTQRTDIHENLPKGRIFSVCLTKDQSRLFYSQMTTTGPRVFEHVIGSGTPDNEIFGDGYGTEKILSIDLSDTDNHLLVTVYYGAGAQKTELHLIDLGHAYRHSVLVDDIEARFEGEIIGNDIYIKTNWNASRDRVLLAKTDSTSPEEWMELIPEMEGSLEGFTLVGGKLFCNYLENVNSVVRVYSSMGEFLSTISLEALGTVSGVYGRWQSTEAFYSFSSFHISPSTFCYDIQTGKSTLWSSIDAPDEYNNLKLEQIWYSTKDGTRVPMFLVSKADLVLDGNRPVYLTGYGGFGNSMTPYFSAVAAIWASAGGVFALPNLRGGGEFGEDWHRAGMLESKQNVFDDFECAMDWLVSNNYTAYNKIAISGGSNGGLLVGAAMTQHPEKMRAVVCSVPLLDMVRYHKFLVANFWIPEYGCSEDAEQFEYLFKYSPYHHVDPEQKYPATLFVTGDSDTRVAPLHARKMCALIQNKTESDFPILLQYHTKSGHSGGMPLTKQIEDTSAQLAFLFCELGVTI